MCDHKDHWEKVYATRQPAEVSWTQVVPEPSLTLVSSLQPQADAAIIDIGGGDSMLADVLLQQGFNNITVLDISGAALNRAQQRLGSNAEQIAWVESDVLEFTPPQVYDIWHDRAAFHFLTTQQDIERYVQAATKNIVHGRHAIIGTFAEDGPGKCSGLAVTRYTPQTLAATFSHSFTLVNFMHHQHTTPFNTLQQFVFCVLQRK